LGNVHVPTQRRIKLDTKSIKCVFLGVSENSKAYRMFYPISNKIIISRDVVFEEDKQWNWGDHGQEKEADFQWGDHGKSRIGDEWEPFPEQEGNGFAVAETEGNGFGNNEGCAEQDDGQAELEELVEDQAELG
jgi:hypothetical protein